MRRGLGLVLPGLLLGACASGGAGPAPGDSPQSVEELRRQVADLRFEVELHRRVAVYQADLGGLRAEVGAVRAALQALVRDLEQRQLEADQALGRRVGGLESRVAELAAAVARLETALAELGRRRGTGAAPAPPAAGGRSPGAVVAPPARPASAPTR